MKMEKSNEDLIIKFWSKFKAIFDYLNCLFFYLKTLSWHNIA